MWRVFYLVMTRTDEFNDSIIPLLRDEGVHCDDRCLRRENFLRENAVNFRIGVEAGVLDDDASEVQVECPSQRGEGDATR